MPARSTRPKDRKLRIYECAASLFREKGYKAASMRELAERVGLEVSSLYSHIDSKQELLEQICFENAGRFVEGLDAIEREVREPAGRMRRILELHIDIAADDLSSITVFNDEWKHLEKPALQRFLEMRKQYEARVTAVIRQGIEEGSFKALDPAILLYSLLGVTRWIHDWIKPGKAVDRQALKATIGTLMLDGLLKN